MNRAKKLALTVGGALVLIAAVAIPAVAGDQDNFMPRCSQHDVRCQNGTQSAAPWVAFPNGEFFCRQTNQTNGPEDSGGEPDMTFCIRRYDDLVFARDNAQDHHSVVTYMDKIASDAEWNCRNPHGWGTWARCDMDWPEGSRFAVLGFEFAQDYMGDVGGWGTPMGFED